MITINIGPETIARRTLPNGMVALARANPTTPTVTLTGLLPVGSIAEPAEQAGLASFVASMLMRGTTTRTFAEINEMVESVGASINVSGSSHATSFSGESLVEDLPIILDALADVLTQPVFPADQVEKLRGQVLTGIQERENNTRSMAALAFRALAYPNHPYGRAQSGYRESVSAFTRDHLVNFYNAHFHPRGGVVVLVGDIQPEAALDWLEKAFGAWQRPQAGPPATLPEVAPVTDVRRKVIAMPGKIQADIVLGAPGLARSSPDYFPALVANTILGRFGLMGRLGENVREKQGLAYYAYSTFEAGSGPGPWMAIAGVNPKSVDAAIGGILHEIKRLGTERIPDEEIADIKSYLTGSQPLRLETNGGVAGAILDMEWHQLGLDYLQRYPDLVNAVTVEEAMAVTRKYLNPDAYALAIAGPPNGNAG